MIPQTLQRAMERLDGAIDSLEAAVGRRARIDEARRNADDERTLMEEDRARLAAELDEALARAGTLDGANAEVGRRLDRISATVRAVLAEVGGAHTGVTAGVAPPVAAPGREWFMGAPQGQR